MSPEPDLPTANSPAVQEPFEEWPQGGHRRKRRRFSRRKVKKMVRLTLIVALHIIAIALLIYIWVRFAYSPGLNG
jgi:hypothetical protein